MKIIDNELVIESSDPLRFVARQCRGNRFACIVVPTSRKDEFEGSIFKGIIMLSSPEVRFVDDILNILMTESEQGPMLLVGGKNDGQRIGVNSQIKYLNVRTSGSTIGNSEYQTYRLTHIYGSAARFSVYALEGLSTDEVVEKLIAAYPKASQ